MNVLIVQTGEPLHTDSGNPRPMRAINLANVLIENGHDVCIISSAFYHQKKRHRSRQFEKVVISQKLEINLVPSPGYKRNIGLGRLFDHAVLAFRIYRHLKNLSFTPDVVFVGFPPIEVAYVVIKYANSQGVPSIIDVKDQWPSIYLDAMPSFLRPLGRVIFWPYFYLAKQAMYFATGISSMAPSFLDWALQFSGKKSLAYDTVFPLTTLSGDVDEKELIAARLWWKGLGIEANNQKRVCFIGSFMSVFDFKPIQQAAIAAKNNGSSFQFILCGEGGSYAEVKLMMAGLSNVIFPGWIDRPKIEALAEMSQAAIAPYLNIDNFTANIPNKIVDAMSLGLPILSPLQGEVANLISNHGVGMRYGTDTGKSLFNCMQELFKDDCLQQKMAVNAKELYLSKFSFHTVYGSFAKHLESMVKKADGI